MKKIMLVVAFMGACLLTACSKQEPEADSSQVLEVEPVSNTNDPGSPIPENGSNGVQTSGPYVKPGPENTGPSDASLLEPLSSSELEERLTDNAVIENVRITGQVEINAKDVTIRNFILDANGGRYGFRMNTPNSNLTLEDGEIFNMKSSAVLGMGFTARRLNIHDSDGDGIKAQNRVNSSGAVLVESSWIHHLGRGPESHADANQSRSGNSPILFVGNNCDIPIGVSGHRSNACFIINDAEGELVDFTAEHNWLNGGNYTVYCPRDDGNNNVHFRNNQFGRDFRYGAISGNCETWEGNIWDDTGEEV